MEELIRKAIQKTLSAQGAGDVLFSVEWPGDLTYGDFATNAALVGGKLVGKSPKAFAEELAPLLKEELKEHVEQVSVAGPGFINITLLRSEFSRTLLEARTEEWGKGARLKEKRVVVEYSCPNPFKEMHIGHLMSTIIGEALSRVIENAGATVIRDTYGGDVGPHVARALWALQKDGVSDVANATEVDKAYLRGAAAYEESEEAKAEIEALNQEIYAGENSALMGLWRKAREVCLESFREIYKMLGTSFDYYFFESEVTPIGLEIVREGVTKGVFKESDGAVIYDGEKKGLHTLVFITSRGTPTYEAKDVGLAFYKEERILNDEVIIETGAEQIGHFKVFLAALSEIAPLIAAKMTHISHGLMVDTHGKKLSSRLGNAVTAVEIINDIIIRAKERNNDPLIAEQVAIGAIKYMILRQAAGGSVMYDPEQSLSLEGDSGPYLQYSFVRAKTVLEKAGKKGSETDAPGEPFILERLIHRFPEILARAERERAPHHVAQYLLSLAGEWNSFYAKERIIDGEHEAYKLLLAEAFANTMKNGLAVLGIPVPEKM